MEGESCLIRGLAKWGARDSILGYFELSFEIDFLSIGILFISLIKYKIQKHVDT